MKDRLRGVRRFCANLILGLVEDGMLDIYVSCQTSEATALIVEQSCLEAEPDPS
ncbi:hypothetical protein L682_16885 [Aquipseudomonas alcaligenes OT 69]|nr:hypothetical protein L682_16885 [Pseudomonas alcaligenes OT 69]